MIISVRCQRRLHPDAAAKRSTCDRASAAQADDDGDDAGGAAAPAAGAGVRFARGDLPRGFTLGATRDRGRTVITGRPDFSILSMPPTYLPDTAPPAKARPDPGAPEPGERGFGLEVLSAATDSDEDGGRDELEADFMSLGGEADTAGRAASPGVLPRSCVCCVYFFSVNM